MQLAFVVQKRLRNCLLGQVCNKKLWFLTIQVKFNSGGGLSPYRRYCDADLPVLQLLNLVGTNQRCITEVEFSNSLTHTRGCLFISIWVAHMSMQQNGLHEVVRYWQIPLIRAVLDQCDAGRCFDGKQAWSAKKKVYYSLRHGCNLDLVHGWRHL